MINTHGFKKCFPYSKRVLELKQNYNFKRMKIFQKLMNTFLWKINKKETKITNNQKIRIIKKGNKIKFANNDEHFCVFHEHILISMTIFLTWFRQFVFGNIFYKKNEQIMNSINIFCIWWTFLKTYEQIWNWMKFL